MVMQIGQMSKEPTIRWVIAQYAEIEQIARDVADKYVMLLEEIKPSSYGSVDIEIGNDSVYASWWRRGDTDSETFPTALLWGDDDDIVAAVEAEKQARKRRTEENTARIQAELEARERATYARLKEKFEAQ